MTVPRGDQLESRQLLSTAVMPVHGPVLTHPHHALRVHHSAAVERVQSTHHGKAMLAAAPATSTSFHTFAQFNNSNLVSTTAISDNDIWAVGFAIEQWNGTSWSIIAGTAVGQLEGVTALSDGTVTAVSNQGYILQN